MPREQVDRLRRRRRPLQRSAEPDVTDLDAPVLGLDAHVGRDAARLAGHPVDDREVQRVAGARLAGEMGAQLAGVGERPVRQVVPQLRVAGGGRVQRVGVALGVERLQAHALAGQHATLRSARGAEAHARGGRSPSAAARSVASTVLP
jgi:hypothetical protein